MLAGWATAVPCFGYVYWRLDRAAAERGSSVAGYLADSLDGVRWLPWLALMVGYCVVYLLLDAAVLHRVVAWALSPVPYRDLVALRSASYLLSLLNDQVGKVAVALGLRRRCRVPFGSAVSPLAFLLVAEFLSLSLWAAAGYAAARRTLPPALDAVPWLAGGTLTALVAAHLVLTRSGAGQALAERRRWLRAFRLATWRRYVEVLALRAPLVLLAVVVYTVTVRLFGVPVAPAEMFGVLPVVLLGAAVPGPLRAAAVALWVALFPDHPGQMAAFGILQHTLFLVVNASIGLLLLPAAARAVTRSPQSGTAAA